MSTPASNTEHQNNDGFAFRLLTLPREIRDLIYIHALTSSEPIIVWQKKRYWNKHRDPTQGWDLITASTSRNLSSLSLNLFYTNRHISDEALSIFYTDNTFAFHGPHDYHRITTWLTQIGTTNSRHLTKLQIDITDLDKAWQLPDGSRVEYVTTTTPDDETIPIPSTTPARPRHPLLHNPAPTWPEGQVEIIPVAAEEMFTSLTSDPSGEPLTILLQNTTVGYPGYSGLPSDHEMLHTEEFWLSMDLPNLIEAWRVQYGNQAGKREVDVEWLCEAGEEWEGEIKRQLREAGWKVYGEEEYRLEVGYEGAGCSHDRRRWRMKLRPHEERIVASRPNPWM
ncbi:hypothetical protein KVT40_006060 [Elsinoe batatas]|uniref:F-box domain-containing protein n=1 Tax=Elsinoe batatas TaxID=2601811 RepID=A0A8K0KZI8_9PEZI|nr:hypothetical protein KVT40_006060 [Elsinoe batatas]